MYELQHSGGNRGLEHRRSSRLFARDIHRRGCGSVLPETLGGTPDVIGKDLNDPVSCVKTSAEKPSFAYGR